MDKGAYSRRHISLGQRGYFTTATLSSDGQTVALGTSSGVVLLVDGLSLKVIDTISLGNTSIRSISFLGEAICALQENGKITFFRDASGLVQVDFPEDMVQISAVDSDGGRLLFIGKDDGKVSVFEVDQSVQDLKATTMRATELFQFHEHRDFISCFCYIEGKRSLIVGSGDGAISIINLKKGKVTFVINCSDEVVSIMRIEVSKVHGVGIVAATLEGLIHYYRWEDMSEPTRTLQYSCSIDSIQLQSDRGPLLIAGDDGKLRVAPIHFKGVNDRRCLTLDLEKEGTIDHALFLPSSVPSQLRFLCIIALDERILVLEKDVNNNVEEESSSNKRRKKLPITEEKRSQVDHFFGSL